ncbi:MAG: hypothetical protein ACR2P6_02560 [Gammaproteobacteria bacterium]
MDIQVTAKILAKSTLLGLLLFAVLAGLTACSTEPVAERIGQTIISVPTNQTQQLGQAFRADAEAAVKATQISVCAELAARPQIDSTIKVAELATNKAG